MDWFLHDNGLRLERVNLFQGEGRGGLSCDTGDDGGRGQGRGRGVHIPLSTFCLAKRKKGNKGKKQTVSKEKQLKDYLSPWSKCWRFSHSRASRI